MRLYLFRHGEASYDAETDAERPLTLRGIAQTEALGRTLAYKHFEGLNIIHHSTLRRARETAEHFNKAARFNLPCAPVAGLEPEADPLQTVDWLADQCLPLMLVGHNPHLTYLSSALLTGDVNHTALDFKKGALLCLEPGRPGTAAAPPGQWLLKWFYVPSLLKEPK